jgi:hypothetical protein
MEFATLTRALPDFESETDRTAFFTEAALLFVLGHVRSNLIHNLDVKWNTNALRNKSEQDLTKLTQSIRNGAEKFREEVAIPIFLSRKFFVPNQEFSERIPFEFNHLPKLELSPEGFSALKSGEFCPLGGNHRRMAIQKLTGEYDTELGTLRKAKKAGEEQLARIRELEKKRDEISEWPWMIYDLGEL